MKLIIFPFLLLEFEDMIFKVILNSRSSWHSCLSVGIKGMSYHGHVVILLKMQWINLLGHLEHLNNKC